MSCDAKIRPFRGVNETELGCDAGDDEHQVHEGILRDYAAPGSVQTLSWDDGDRRTFRGEFRECPQDGCLLPEFHAGRHEL